MKLSKSTAQKDGIEKKSMRREKRGEKENEKGRAKGETGKDATLLN